MTEIHEIKIAWVEMHMNQIIRAIQQNIIYIMTENLKQILLNC